MSELIGPIVTTSWDDGHVLDLRLGALLARYGISGTFYVAPQNVEFPPEERLSDTELAKLATDFEIGAHTLTHRRLTSLSPDEARREIVAGKDALESIIGAPVTAFCYPGGLYDLGHVELVRDAGFRVARTTQRFAMSLPADPLQMPTTVHAYRHLADGPALKAANFRPLLAFNLVRCWDRLAERLFDQVLAKNGVFHLWGHSWEVDRHNDWERLERVLAYIGFRPGVRYVVNSALIDKDEGI